MVWLRCWLSESHRGRRGFSPAVSSCRFFGAHVVRLFLTRIKQSAGILLTPHSGSKASAGLVRKLSAFVIAASRYENSFEPWTSGTAGQGGNIRGKSPTEKCLASAQTDCVIGHGSPNWELRLRWSQVYSNNKALFGREETALSVPVKLQVWIIGLQIHWPFVYNRKYGVSLVKTD